jgi:hypothetical protein
LNFELGKLLNFWIFPTKLIHIFEALGKIQKERKLKIQFKFESLLELKISNFGKILLELEVAKVADF